MTHSIENNMYHCKSKRMSRFIRYSFVVNDTRFRVMSVSVAQPVHVRNHAVLFAMIHTKC